MARLESPGSSLSSYSSEDFPEDVKPTHRELSEDPDLDSGRPSKRPRLGRDGPSPPPAESEFEGDISSDTSGSVPASPLHPGDPDEYSHERQVTFCKWEGCEVGNLGNMDNLVEHLHDDHIGIRQKKYSCEWVECSRKGIAHASGYALRAHMRSHTREKPFFCTLPECDRSFTRSDALAKHMRTVHETEALRPSDPVPKHHSSNPSNKFQRLRLVFNKSSDKPFGPSPTSPWQAQHPPANAESEGPKSSGPLTTDAPSPTASPNKQPSQDVFTEEEQSLSVLDLMKTLRRKQHWALQESEELKAEMEVLEKKRKQEWMEKELVLENAAEEDLNRMMRKRAEMGMTIDGLRTLLVGDLEPAKKLELHGQGAKPWFRQQSMIWNDIDRSSNRQASEQAHTHGGQTYRRQ